MTNPVTVKHSYNAGDLISILPGFKKNFEDNDQKVIIYQELGFPVEMNGFDHPIKNEEGQHVCMNQGMFDMLYPLIRNQQYVEDFRVWGGEKVDYDFGMVRDGKQVPIPNGSIFHWPFMTFPDLTCDVSAPWIDIVRKSKNAHWLGDKIVVNRTSRYTNPYIHYGFLKEYGDKVLFMGTHNEWLSFNKAFGLDTGLMPVLDFMEAAQKIQACKLFIGNQSLLWHIANSIGADNILELSSDYPNCWPTTAGGHGIAYQQALEHLVKKLMKKEPKLWY